MAKREKTARQWTTLRCVIQVAREPVHKQLNQEAFQLANIPVEGTDDSTATIICTAGELATYVCTYAWLKMPRCANSCVPFGTFCFCVFARRKWDQLCRRQPVYTLSPNNSKGTETAESSYHGKTDICLLEGGAVVGSVSRHCHHLSGFAHRAIDDT